MYKFKASQFYKVERDGVSVKFDYFGEYKTEKPEEIELLKSLVPTYIQLLEEPKVQPEKQEKEEKLEVEKAVEEKQEKVNDKPKKSSKK